MFVKIEKELSDRRKQENKACDDATKEVKLLQTAEAAEDLRILRGLGTNSKQVAAERKLGYKIELEKLDEKFDGKVFTLDEVERLAIKYRLRFLNSRLFTGKMDVQCLAKIKQFAKNHPEFTIDEYSLGTNFFILAPASQFKLRKDSNFSPLVNTITNFLETFRDPVMFYKVAPQRFKLVHKWGLDFTILRLFRGVIWQNRVNFMVAFFIVLMGLISMFDAWVGLLGQSPVATIVVSTLISGGLAWLAAVSLKDSHFSEENWNEDIKA